MKIIFYLCFFVSTVCGVRPLTLPKPTGLINNNHYIKSVSGREEGSLRNFHTINVLKINRGGSVIISKSKELHQFSRGGVATSAKSQDDKSTPSSFTPISRSEMPLFLSISFMMFLFIYVFTTVRDTKDTLVVSNCGAEAIPFLKLYGVMPCAFLFIMTYTKLSQSVGKKALFYLTLLPFFLFYAVFAFVLFPNRDVIHFVSDSTMAGSGVGKAAFSLLQYWSFSLYFIVSELWASAGVPLLFWQVANDVTPLTQAKRFYPLFAVIGNLAPIMSGKIMSYIVSLQKSSDDIGFGYTLKRLALIKSAICIGILTLYNVVYKLAPRQSNKSVETKNNKPQINVSRSEDKIEIKIKRESAKVDTVQKTPSKKPSLSESMKELSKSKELKAMFIMVFCYNTCIELTEVLWKGILRKTYSNKSAYMSYMAKFSQTVGFISLLLQISASAIIRKIGWRWSASLTPLVMCTLAVPFFVSVMLTNVGGSVRSVSLATALTIGTIQNIASKVTKYSLFDPCKEMAYIPLGPDAKTKGKAAVDVLGARLGRSMGSASQQVLVSFFGGGSILHCSPYLGTIYLLTVGYWMKAVRVLSRLFSETNETGDKKKN